MIVAVSVGDPAGVGPQVTVEALATLQSRGRFAPPGTGTPGDSALVFGDVDRLARLARDQGLELGGGVRLVRAGAWTDSTVEAHRPTPQGGAAQLNALTQAARAVLDGRADALVTGPTSKEAIVAAGHAFVGQTEYLAGLAGVPADSVTMMFLGERLRVALVTTHLPVRRVPDALSADGVVRASVHLGEALVRLGGDRPSVPTVVVAGLNPHAGEGGLFGEEDAKVIEPALARAKGYEPYATGRVQLVGVVPAESAFRRAVRGHYQGVVAMMHDHATIASKLVDWGRAVNVTWGLPFLRTSVDHGVAYDAAAAGSAESDGMVAALEAALRLKG